MHTEHTEPWLVRALLFIIGRTGGLDWDQAVRACRLYLTNHGFTVYEPGHDPVQDDPDDGLPYSSFSEPADNDPRAPWIRDPEAEDVCEHSFAIFCP